MNLSKLAKIRHNPLPQNIQTQLEKIISFTGVTNFNSCKQNDARYREVFIYEKLGLFSEGKNINVQKRCN